jgi:hypothetical protein
MKYKKELEKIFLSLREVLREYDDCIIKKINSIDLYANEKGSYFTAKIDNSKYNFHYSYDEIRCDEIDEREELLIIDAFEDLYELIYKIVNKEKIRYEKIIDKLFQDFLKRRKITPTKKYLELSKLQSKTYI